MKNFKKTITFAWFLFRNKALIAFIKNYMNGKPQATFLYTIKKLHSYDGKITAAFIFDKTPQGLDFWVKLRNKNQGI